MQGDSGGSEGPTRQVIKLPIPPRSVGGNKSYANPMYQHSARKAYKKKCEAYILNQMPYPVEGPCVIRIAYSVPAVRNTKARRATRSRPYFPTDADNASRACKGAIDALVSTGVIPDDSEKWITNIGTEIVPTEGEDLWLYITIEEAEDERGGTS